MKTLLYVLVLSFNVFACPLTLQTLKTDYLGSMDLCQAYDRYHAALGKLESKGITNPERISTIYGPRFINFPDWTKLAEKNKYDPWYVYQPAPLTWEKWEVGAKVVDSLAAQNHSNSRMETIDMNWLLKLHGAALTGLLETAGVFRTGTELGKAFEKSTSLTQEQISGLNSLTYRSTLNTSERLVSWHPTLCLEDKSPEEAAEYRLNPRSVNLGKWPELKEPKYFTGDDGKQRQCGYLLYSSSSDVAPQIKAWFEFLDSSIASINNLSANTDPILLAAKSQQWFIVIHPFVGGNGRVSRFVMDYFTKSLGLPAAILKDMDGDVYSSTQDWARQVGRGIEYAVKYAEYCAAGTGVEKGCNIVTQSATLAQ